MVPNNTKTVIVAPPQTVNSGNAAVLLLDTQGWRYARWQVSVGAIAANITALKVRESDTGNTGNSTLTGTVADVTGAVFGTSVNIAGSTSALPTTSDANTVFEIDMDLRGRKRYMALVCTAGSGNDIVSGTVQLSRGDESPESASERGVAQSLRVPAI